MLSGGLNPDNVQEAIATVRPFAVDVASGVEASPGRKDPEKLSRFFEAVRAATPATRLMATPSLERRFGRYGGRYVPETLMPALEQLEQAWRDARSDERFGHALDVLLHRYAGRPTPLYEATRLSERVGAPVYLKREDLLHTGAHKINNALGQALLAQRMGKRRVIAETGAGQHGVATATACALLGLDCVVYMGTEDMRRQRPNVERMELLGATVEPVETGARTLKEAVSAAIRDWVTNVDSTHYVIGSAVGPAPYPLLVRDLQRVIGDEARAQILEQAGRLPDRIVACVGGGSNAIGTFHPFLADDEVELVGSRGRRRGAGERPPRRLARRRQPGRAARRAFVGACRTPTGRSSRPTRSRPGSTTRAWDPSTLTCATSGRVHYESVTDDQALAAFRELARLEGIIPALEPAHAIAWVLANPRPRGLDHARHPQRPRRQGSGRGARKGRLTAQVSAPAGAERIAGAFASAPGRAALMPYMMGGFPDLPGSLRVGQEFAGAGADLIELGIPFSDPLADGPAIQAAGQRALGSGRDVRGRAGRRSPRRWPRPSRWS